MYFLIVSLFELTLVLKFINCFELFTPHCDDPLQGEYGKLIYASVVFRHGERTPLGAYPLDPYRNYSWPVQYGELMDKGKRRLFELGKMLKKRYNCLVPTDYDSLSIRVDSSDFDRTLMSAQCLLYGFYHESSSNSRWADPATTWNPVPIHSVPKYHDNMLSCMRTKKCQKFDDLIEALEDDQRLQTLFQQNYELLKVVERNTGLKITSMKKFQAITTLDEHIRDALKIQEENNLFLSEDINMPSVSTIEEFLTFALNYYLSSSNYQIDQLFATPILRSITSDMLRKNESVSNNNNNNNITSSSENEKTKFDQKIHFYSSHDSSIGYITMMFNQFHPYPDYGGNLLFELRDKDGIKVITVSKMYNTEGGQWSLLEMPTFGYSCTLEEFKNWIDVVTLKDWQKTCDESF